MKKIPAYSYPFFIFGVLVVLPVAFTVLLVPGMWSNFLAKDQFMPHIHCYLQNMRAVWLHVSSDALIGLSYVAISTMLGYLVYKARKDIPFQWMFIGFGLFIVACGLTHFMEVWTMWQPRYWLSGSIKLITAVASVATACALPLILPKIFVLIETAKASEQRRVQLERAHDELEGLYSQVKELDHLKSSFFANVSHELRTPLTLILGQTARLNESTNLTREQRGDLEAVRKNGLLLLRHVNDLLEASKLEAGKMQVFYHRTNLSTLIRRVISHFPTLADSRGLKFSSSIQEDIQADVDPEKIEKILFNLISNALKFVPRSGAVQISLTREGERALIKVQDNGPGIPDSKKHTVFERFQQLDSGPTRKAGGTGLGLSIARDFAELHKGTIRAEDTPGGGATFVVELPLRAPEGENVSQTEFDLSLSENLASQVVAGLTSDSLVMPLSRAAVGKPIVMVVEDNSDMAEYIVRLLEPEFGVVHCRDGLEAMESLQRQSPELIITDIMMPRMSGDQLVRAIRSKSELSDIPIIILSAKADDPIRLDLLRNGAQDYLTKPFAPEEFRARVKNLHDLRLSQSTLRDLNTQLEQFNYSVSHDLRAPIRSVKGFGSMILDEYKKQLQGSGLTYLEKILNAASRMERLIDDLLAYSRVCRGDHVTGPVELREAIQEAQSQLETPILDSKGHVWLEGEFPQVTANRTILVQAISNLLSNAIKYLAPGSKPQVRVYSTIANGKVRLFVQDNGIGIKPEHQAKIFRPFERLHGASEYPGSGVGLALVKKGIERMNGSVGVDSEPGKGSTFWIELPLANAG